jgi:hypothetical protein
MSLQEREISYGAIAYFDALALNGDPSVSVSGDPVDREGSGSQFVCYDVGEGRSRWAPLTGTERPERMRVEAAWVSNGYGPLGRGEVFLQDGKNTYSGPNGSFVAGAAGESPFPAGRPMISTAGMVEVVRVISERGGQL